MAVLTEWLDLNAERSNFPTEVCNMEPMTNPDANTQSYVIAYNALIAANNYIDAAAYLVAHPTLETCVFDADKLNIILDEIKATQYTFKYNVDTYIAGLQAKLGTSGMIDDSQAVANLTYSSAKVKTLVDAITNYTYGKIRTYILNRTINAEDWGTSSYTVTISVPGVKATDIVDVYFTKSTIDTIAKMNVKVESGLNCVILSASKVKGTSTIESIKAVSSL